VLVGNRLFDSLLFLYLFHFAGTFSFSFRLFQIVLFRLFRFWGLLFWLSLSFGSCLLFLQFHASLLL